MARTDIDRVGKSLRIEELESAIRVMAEIAGDFPVGHKELAQIRDVARRTLAPSEALEVD